MPLSWLGSQGQERVDTTGAVDLIDRLASCGRQEPGTGMRWYPMVRPASCRFDEGVLCCILCHVEIPEVSDQDRNDTRPLRGEGLLECRCRHLAIGGPAPIRQSSNVMIGRISTRPKCTFGIFAAQSSASSRFDTSMT